MTRRTWVHKNCPGCGLPFRFLETHFEGETTHAQQDHADRRRWKTCPACEAEAQARTYQVRIQKLRAFAMAWRASRLTRKAAKG